MSFGECLEYIALLFGEHTICNNTATICTTPSQIILSQSISFPMSYADDTIFNFAYYATKYVFKCTGSVLPSSSSHGFDVLLDHILALPMNKEKLAAIKFCPKEIFTDADIGTIPCPVIPVTQLHSLLKLTWDICKSDLCNKYMLICCASHIDVVQIVMYMVLKLGYYN
jgi:hypothetical protein